MFNISLKRLKFNFANVQKLIFPNASKKKKSKKNKICL